MQRLLLAALALEAGVAAAPQRQFRTLEMQDVVGDVVEQIAVVADDDDRRRIGLEIVDQPQHAFEIEIVGGFVEQQEVGGREQHRGERDAHAPAAGKLREGAVLRRLVEAEAAQDARGARRGGVGVDIDKTGLDFGDAQRIVRRLGLAEEGGALAVGVEHEVDQRLRAAGRLLLDAADAGLPGNRDRTALAADFAADQAEQRGLAGAVAPDQADVGAGRQRHGRVIDQQALAEAIGQIVDMQHGGAFDAPRRPRQGARAGQSVVCGQSPRPLTLPLPVNGERSCGGAFLPLSPLAGRGRVRGGVTGRRLGRASPAPLLSRRRPLYMPRL